MTNAPFAAPPQKPASALASATLTCFHCHDVCPDARLHIGEKNFCCEGCKMVYEILNTNDLCQYYDLDPQAGVSMKIRKDARAYAWLDDPDVQAKLIQFTDGRTTRATFYAPAMHCASCIWLLEHLYRLDAGVTHSKVNFLKKQVIVQFDAGQTSLRKIAAMLASIGYPPEINLGDVEGETAKAVDKSLMYKIGVAGFAFGNIMLLSFPEYLGLEKEREAWFFGIFGYLNLLLGLPVLLYSARDYFVSAYNGLKNKHLNLDVPLALGMAVLFGRSAYEILTGTGAGFMDSFAGLLFFLTLGKLFQQKTYHHLSFERDYKSYFPVAATLLRDGAEASVPVSKLEPGDILRVRNQELIPADGILLKGAAQVDYSFVTGEAEPVVVRSGERVFAGGKQVGGSIEISITRRVNQSYLTQLWNDEAFKTKVKGHASILADKAGRYFTGLILGVGTAAFLYWWLWRGEASTAVNAFTAVLIIACPCAVALSIPFTMGNVLRVLGRNRFYIKNTNVIEAFTAVNAVVFDKTGTLTVDGGRQTAGGGHTIWIPTSPNSSFNIHHSSLIKSLARHSAHPLSRRIFEAMPADAPVFEVENFSEITGNGIVGNIAGQVVRLGSAQFIFGKTRPEKGVFVEIEGQVVGHFEFKNRYREDMAPVLKFFERWTADGGRKTVDGWRANNQQPTISNQQSRPVFLLSGDNDREAGALQQYFAAPGSLHFNQSPQDKLDFVKNLQRSGHAVLMVGDGLNDAGALRQSDVGIVVSENTNNFTPACDAILHADEFGRLPQFFQLAQSGMKLVDRAYLLAACYNVVGLSFAVSGTLSPVVAAILMPLSSVTIIAFGTAAVNWKAWRLGL